MRLVTIPQFRDMITNTINFVSRHKNAQAAPDSQASSLVLLINVTALFKTPKKPLQLCYMITPLCAVVMPRIPYYTTTEYE